MKRKKKWIIIVIVVLLINVAMFFWVANKKEMVGERINNPDLYSVTFERMNMDESNMMDLKAGDVLEVEYDIEKGHVAMSIGIDKEEPIYTGKGLDKGSFTLNINKDGEYRVYVSVLQAQNGRIVIKKAD